MEQIATHGWEQAWEQGWASYRVVFAAMAVAMLFPLLLLVLGKLAGVWRREPRRASIGVKATPLSADGTLNTRYFSAAQMGGLIGLPMLLMVPLVGESGRLVALSVLTLCATTGCALVYANRKSDLRWKSETTPPATGDPGAR